MNSWKSTLLSACAPPFRTFSIGTGRSARVDAAEVAVERQVPRRRAAARATAMRDAEDCVGAELVLVRRCRRARSSFASTAPWSSASRPTTAGAMSSLTLPTALATPLPPKRFLSPSRSSRASRVPVDAPDGTPARPKERSSSWTSTSTVGLPRESRISLAFTLAIAVTSYSFVCGEAPEEVPGIGRAAPAGALRHHRSHWPPISGGCRRTPPPSWQEKRTPPRVHRQRPRADTSPG